MGCQQHKAEHAGDVKGQTGPQDSEPRVEGGLVQRITPGHEAAARGLQNESDKVTKHEDDGVGARLESGVGGPVHGDNTRETEVQGGAEKGRADGDSYDIPGRKLGTRLARLPSVALISVKVPEEQAKTGSLLPEYILAVMQLDSSYIGNYLQYEA